MCGVSEKLETNSSILVQRRDDPTKRYLAQRWFGYVPDDMPDAISLELYKLSHGEPDRVCPICQNNMSSHGWLPTPVAACKGLILCPGDVVLINIDKSGEVLSLSSHTFASKYKEPALPETMADRCPHCGADASTTSPHAFTCGVDRRSDLLRDEQRTYTCVFAEMISLRDENKRLKQELEAVKSN